MIKVGIIGATGYAGVELVRLLLEHPKVKITALGSSSQEGNLLESIYPSLTGLSLGLSSVDKTVSASDIVFLSLPHGLSEEIAKSALAQGKKVIDLGADFRLASEEEYETWYDKPFTCPELHTGVPYGLPELFRESIKGAQLVANPGCYPTSAALGLAPLAEKIGVTDIIIDAKSGVTGSGKSLSEITHFPLCNENLSPYKIGTHRHTPEIEQSLEHLSGKKQFISFTPHLVPVNRGILSTIYCTPEKEISLEEVHSLYEDYYANEFFVRLMPLGKTVTIKQICGSNYCDISVHKNERTGKFIIISAIDNMVKGAAGQAIQNMNILYDLPETTGLTMMPLGI